MEYNYLKLPKKVTFADGKTISYQYLSNGKKLKETTSTGDVTDYVGNVIYKNGALYQISHDEGRVIQNASGSYDYEFDIKDHLGSLRVSFKDSLGIAKTTQESHTGAFGEILTSLTYINTPKPDNFDYTGHERLKTFNLGYIDAGARLYDPFVPRFITIDPLAETSRRFSPYTYALNRPTMFIDPDGMEAEGVKYSNGYSTSDSRDETGAVSHEGAFETAGGGEGSSNNVQGDKPKAKFSSVKSVPTIGEVRKGNGLNPNGDGIQADHTIESVVIPIFKPLGLGLSKFSSFLFGRAISSSSNYLTEKAIISEARLIMQNERLIRNAFESGIGTELQIGGRSIIVEPQAPISGMTLFFDNSFVIGKEAFSSRPELIKTILHELYRLNTSTLRGATGIQELVSKETAAAASFAEKTFNQIK